MLRMKEGEIRKHADSHEELREKERERLRNKDIKVRRRAEKKFKKGTHDEKRRREMWRIKRKRKATATDELTFMPFADRPFFSLELYHIYE